jgi:hypothetical protein
MDSLPLVIEFAPGTRLERESDQSDGLPIVSNGPPGTVVVFPSGRIVPLPTDQIVASRDSEGAATVGFGGMRFEGVDEEQLTFRRFKDVQKEEALSPERGMKMTLEISMVEFIRSYGRVVWVSETIKH